MTTADRKSTVTQIGTLYRYIKPCSIYKACDIALVPCASSLPQIFNCEVWCGFVWRDLDILRILNACFGFFIGLRNHVIICISVNTHLISYLTLILSLLSKALNWTQFSNTLEFNCASVYMWQIKATLFFLLFYFLLKLKWNIINAEKSILDSRFTLSTPESLIQTSPTLRGAKISLI